MFASRGKREFETSQQLIIFPLLVERRALATAPST